MELEQRVEQLESQVRQLHYEVEALKRSQAQQPLQQQAQQPIRQQVQQPIQQFQSNQQRQLQQGVAAPQYQGQTGQYTAPVNNTVPGGQWSAHIPKQTQKPIKQRNTDLEAFIGKNVFVIIASILIFIGVVVFAGILLPYLTQEVKFILMFAASTLFTGFSYWLVNRKQNALTVSMLACGLGTVYITLFTGNLYFKLISTAWLYISLLAWVVVVYFCSKYKSLIFNLIGQAGIILSLVICVSRALATGEQAFILYALIYVAVAEILYDVLFRKEHYMINAISMFLSIFVLSFPIILRLDDSSDRFILFRLMQVFIEEIFTKPDGYTVAFGALIILFAYAMIKNIILIYKRRITTTAYAVCSIIGTLVYITMMLEFSSSKTAQGLMAGYCILTFILTEFIFHHEERNVILGIASCLPLGILSVLYYAILDKPAIPVLILALPLLLYVLRTNTTCQHFVAYAGLACMGLINLMYIFTEEPRFIVSRADNIPDDIYYIQAPPDEAILSGHNVLFYISILVITTICYIIIHKYEKQYKSAGMLAYLFTGLNILYPLSAMCDYAPYPFDVPLPKGADELMMLMRMIAAVIFQLIFKHICQPKDNIPVFTQGTSVAKNNMSAFKQDTFVAYFITNAYLMFRASCSLYELEDFTGLYLIGALAVIILFTLNTNVLLQKPNTASSAYMGVKITVLIIVVMHAFELQPLVSIMLFLWAAACIWIGLKKEQKPLRIFALILSLLSTAKLILIDLAYDHAIAHALSFIICGLLCFAISYIYHRIELTAKANNMTAPPDVKVNNVTIPPEGPVDHTQLHQ